MVALEQFAGGAKGSQILVTARSAEVAKSVTSGTDEITQPVI